MKGFTRAYPQRGSMAAVTGRIQALTDKWRAQAETWTLQDAHVRAAAVAEEVLRDLEALGDAPLTGPETYNLTVFQVAPIMGVRPQWLYRHWQTLGFGHKHGRRMLRFSEAGLHRWLSQH